MEEFASRQSPGAKISATAVLHPEQYQPWIEFQSQAVFEGSV